MYEFYVKRFIRIIPAYLIILAIVFTMSLFVPSLAQKINSISDILFSFFLYVYNYAKFWTEGEVPGALNIMWSLSFEEQFYVLLGLTFLLFNKRFFDALFIIGFASLCVRFMTLYSFEYYCFNRLQFQTHLRLDAIIWGCLLYLSFEKCKSFLETFKASRSFIFLGITSTFLLSNNSWTDWAVASQFTFTAIFFTLLILYVQATPKSLVTQFFQLSALTFIGKISYEIYLTHQLINGLIIKIGLDRNIWIYSISLLSMTLILSWLFYKLINNPIQKYLKLKLL